MKKDQKNIFLNMNIYIYIYYPHLVYFLTLYPENRNFSRKGTFRGLDDPYMWGNIFYAQI